MEFVYSEGVASIQSSAGVFLMNKRERGTNKRAQIRKERAKAKSLGERLMETLPPPDLKEWGGEGPSGIVAEIMPGNAEVLLYENERYEHSVNVRVPKSISNGLLVGDRVSLATSDDEVSIKAIQPRHTTFSRIRGDEERWSAASLQVHSIAANLDLVVIVASLSEPELHPSLIDRYLVLCDLQQVEMMICLTKADLIEQRPSIENWYKHSLGIKCIETSIKDKDSLVSLRDSLRAKVSVFVGESGVGKSSLVNVLAGETLQKTGVVGRKSHVGRHTTTASSLVQWSPGSFIVDTPGIRSLRVLGVSPRRLAEAFQDFTSYGQECEFSDCIHVAEPGCGVKAAVNANMIPLERYDSYLLLVEEITGRRIVRDLQSTQVQIKNQKQSKQSLL